MSALAGRNLIRIAAVAVGLSTLSFAAGVAGDLSILDPPRSGQSVVLRIPPELPTNTVRAAPLPQLISTASAGTSARVERVSVRFEEAQIAVDGVIAIREKPEPRLEVQLARIVPKSEQVVASAPDERKAA
jgi:hypothetical protein